jgi:hypothetical protein
MEVLSTIRRAFAKQRQRLLDGEQQSAHIRVERLVEMFLGDLSECTELIDPAFFAST